MQRQFWERFVLKNRRTPTHPVVSTYSNSKLDLIFEKIDLKDIKDVLEVGCGNGFFSYKLNQKINHFIGLDFSALLLSLIKGQNIPLIRADALFLPFQESSFDLVFSANLLHHVDNHLTVIREMKRVCSKYIVIIEPNIQNPLMFFYFIIKKEEDQRKIFTLNTLKTILLNENLTIIDAFSTGSIGPNITPPFLLRILKLLDKKQSKLSLYNIVIGRLHF